jgi:hypothetical protein
VGAPKEPTQLELDVQGIRVALERLAHNIGVLVERALKEPKGGGPKAPPAQEPPAPKGA